jgi:ABC-2 type transport system ATP-binding protein
MITVRDLSKHYGTVKALDRVSLDLGEGLVHGVVGTNGAGKTTLFNCLAGMISYTGQISCDKGKLRGRMGFLLTEPFFPSYITGREYLRLMCQARRLRPRNLDRANIFDLPLNRYANAYSTGMKKKLALLGILLQKNDVFVLDEPFNGVDLQSNLMIGQIILRLRDLGRTVLVSSHILSTLADTCDFISLLREGRLEKTFSREEFAGIESKMAQAELAQLLERLEL